MKRLEDLAPFGLILGLALCVGCGDVTQEYRSGSAGAASGGEAGVVGVSGGGGVSGTGGVIEGTGGTAGADATWDWLAPEPHGNGFRAIHGSSVNDVWLGGRGELHHWNGEQWSIQRPGSQNDLYHAIWSFGAANVWVGGTRLVFTPGKGEPEDQGLLLHFNGSEWKSFDAFEGRTVLALTAAPGGVLFASLDGGSIWKFASGAWQDTKSPATVDLPALWAAANDDVWAAGHNGALLRFEGSTWTQHKPAAEDGPLYLGVWGAAADDVWAVYEEQVGKSEDRRIGFSHWDGAKWTLEQEGKARSTAAVIAVSGFKVQGYGIYPHESVYSNLAPAAAPINRRGNRIWGTSKDNILVSAGFDRGLWHFNGSSWNLEVQATSDYLPSQGIYHMSFPLGRTPTVWGAAPGQLFAAGAAGQLMAYEPEKPAPVAPEDGLYPRWKSVFPASRRYLGSVTSAPSGTHAVIRADDRGNSIHSPNAWGFGGLAAWTANGWVDVPGPGYKVAEIADNDGDLFAFGTEWKPTGSTRLWSRRTATGWQDLPLPKGSVATGIGRPWFEPGNNAVWMTSQYSVLRYDGTQTQEWTLPVESGTAYPMSIHGTAADDVWVIAENYPPVTSGALHLDFVVFHFDGKSFSEVYRRDIPGDYSLVNVASPRIYANGKDDVWVLAAYRPGSPPTGIWKWTEFSMRWDGKVWTPWAVGAAEVRDLEVRAADDAYLLSLTQGGSVIRHFNGTDWTTVFAADSLTSLDSTPTRLWAVGGRGRTVVRELKAPPN